MDRKSGRLSIGSKIIGREGVSARTTGNLQLTGEYEEFGEELAKVRERRGALAATATCRVKALAGATTLRAMMYHPEAGPPCDVPPKELKARLRAAPHRHAAVLHAAQGAVDWSSPP